MHCTVCYCICIYMHVCTYVRTYRVVRICVFMHVFCAFFICRLREMLREEEESYVAEVAQQVETPIERQAKMRERARQLREKREVERLEIVQSKLDQRWR